MMTSSNTGGHKEPSKDTSEHWTTATVERGDEEEVSRPISSGITLNRGSSHTHLSLIQTERLKQNDLTVKGITPMDE